MFIVTTLVAIGILNGLLDFTYEYGYILEGILFGVFFLLYLSLLWRPKTYPRKDFDDIYLDIRNKFCYECMRPTPKRGYHCDICHVCIEQYDHHCTWINNCVGKRNIGRFIFFLVFLILSLLYVGLVSVMSMVCLFMNNLDHFK